MALALHPTVSSFLQEDLHSENAQIYAGPAHSIVCGRLIPSSGSNIRDPHIVMQEMPCALRYREYAFYLANILDD